MAKMKKQSVVIYEDWITVMQFLSKDEIIEFLNTTISVMKGEDGAITSSDGVRVLLEMALPDLLDNKNKRQKRSDIGKNNFKNNPKLGHLLTDISTDVGSDIGSDIDSDIDSILTSITVRGNGDGDGNVDGNGNGNDRWKMVNGRRVYNKMYIDEELS